ncbi:head-tail connector protein [Cereibacter sphaeroides]|nr:head-tail connector protein [Cereibacter sphaeroides]
MTPVLVVAPTAELVGLEDLKLHCRIDADDEDDLIAAYAAAAQAWLDGWSGVLGRAIMPQTWSVTATAGGCLLLPMPDVQSAVVDYGDGDQALDVTVSDAGPVVELADPGTVEFECGLPEAKRAVVVLIVKMLVQHWYANRGAVNNGGGTSEVPMSASALVETLRWRRV